MIVAHDREPTVLESKFDEWIAKRAIVEINRDHLNTNTLVGRIVRRSEGMFLMEKLDELYRADGLCVARLDDVTRVSAGGRELEAGAELADKPYCPTDLPRTLLDELVSAAMALQARFGHVTLHVDGHQGTCFIGQIRAFDDDFVLMDAIGTMKSLDMSEMLLRGDQITSVEAGGNYEKALSRLQPRMRKGSGAA